MIRRRFFPVVFLFLLNNTISQAQSLVGLHPELQWRYARQVYAHPEIHSMMQPWNMFEIQSITSVQTDRIKDFQYFIHPLAGIQLSVGSPFRQSYEAGIHTGFSYKKKLAVDFNYALAGKQFYEADQAYIDSTGLIPHYDRYLSHNGNFYLYQSLNFSVSWTPIEYITVRIGKDRQFWGDGYRSLYLSDNAYSYPFLQTIFKFWHVKYIFMTSRMSDYKLDEHFSTRHKKYTSMHTLSWNVTPKINLNLFEVIVWDAIDSISKRTFDINYLNPVIFFRPVEYSLGSPDNVLIGFGGKFNVWRENYLYGQFILDEFKLDEIRKGEWWANKYAFQIGLRSFWGERRPLMLQAEFNQIRPYTYTHYYPLQNFGHLVDALAHPMGANLREGLVIARWAFAPNWSAHLKATYAVQGTDSVGKNFGGNIYKSNLTHGDAYGHTILQGVRAVTTYQELKVTRTIVPKWNMQVEAILSNRFYNRDEKTTNNFYFSVGLKTLLYRE